MKPDSRNRIDLTPYSIKDLFLTAIKCEIESKKVYLVQAQRVENIFLKEKLHFLSKEEEKHRAILEQEYRKRFNTNTITIPEESPVPVPEFSSNVHEIPIEDVIEMAMEIELAARDYYLSLGSIVGKDTPVGKTLDFLASMELGHYQLLKVERNNLILNKEFDTIWKSF